MLVYAQDHETLLPDLDLDTESVLLAATIDGLPIHAVTVERDVWPLIEAAIDAALSHLFVADDGWRSDQIS